MNLSNALLVLAALLPGQEPSADFSFDFRGGKPLPSALSLFPRPDGDKVVKLENEGLHVTAPTHGQLFGAPGLAFSTPGGWWGTPVVM